MAFRRITVEGNIHVVDHENLGEDERETAFVFGEAIVDTDGVSVELVRSEVGVGGEVRVELELYVRATKESAQISGIARLFEGASESTNDLDDEMVISGFVGPLGPLNQEVFLQNKETDPLSNKSDYANITLTYRNLPANITLTSGGGLVEALPKQDQWSWCHKCNGLWWSGSDNAGRCAAGGGHDSSAGSFNYALVANVGYPGGQAHWRWCRDCMGLWFANAGQHGRCPAGGGHTYEGSWNYVLTAAADTPGQRNWRWCRLCMGLHAINTGRQGRCASGGGHSLQGSWDYVLTVT